jgi:hypothetical protein
MTKTVYGDQCMSRARCYEWFKRFKDGRQSTHDEPSLGRPSTSCDDAYVEQVRQIVRSDRRLAAREIAEACDVSTGSCHDSLASGSLTVCLTTSDTGSERERESRSHLSVSFGSRWRG